MHSDLVSPWKLDEFYDDIEIQTINMVDFGDFGLPPPIDETDSNPVWTPLVSPSLDFAPSYYEDSLGHSSLIYDTTLEAPMWDIPPTQEGDQSCSPSVVNTGATLDPSDVITKLEPLDTTYGTIEISSRMDCDKHAWPMPGDEQSDDYSSLLNIQSEDTSQQISLAPAWGEWSRASKKNSNRSRAQKKRTNSAGESSKQGARGTRPPRTSKGYSSCKAIASSGSDNETPRATSGNVKHSLTEKRYRSRLNDRFETLLSVISAGELRPGSDNAEKKISKAEVLILAKEHIRILENSTEDLEKQNRELMKDIERTEEVLLRFEKQP